MMTAKHHVESSLIRSAFGSRLRKGWMQRSTSTSLAFLACLFLCAAPALGQKKKGLGFGTGFPEMPAQGAGSDQPIVYAAEYTLSEDGKQGELRVTATLDGEWHTFSVTQPSGGPKPTRISVDKNQIKLGAFKSDSEPTLGESESFPGVSMEEHTGQVTWVAPFEVVGTLKAGESEIEVSIDGQACLPPPVGTCLPINKTIAAKYVSAASTPEIVPFRATDSHGYVTVHIEPAQVRAGGKATIVISIKPQKPYHVYPFVEGSAERDFRTLIVPTKKAELKWGSPMTAAETKDIDLGADKIAYHTGDVEWRIPIQVPADIAEGPQELEVAIGYTTCTDATCDPPAAVRAVGTLNIISPPSAARSAPFAMTEMKFADVAAQPNLASWVDFKVVEKPKVATNVPNKSKSIDQPAQEPAGSLTLKTLGFALLGGFILNFMPCVLPVIGLKVLGFVEQAGSDRSEVVKLNVAYVLGIVAVMWALAGITVATQTAWGQHFTLIEFKLAMAGLVFAMALSFLGVWEIPIPGFATTYKANQLMQREGVVGAFCKGLLTTVLATPCSGPFLGLVFTVTLTLAPWGVFVVYTLVGLGMGLPFLLLCFRPDAVKLLPKPGAWMETLKEALAFPLLLTVVYFVASINADYRIATLSMLVAIWFACWLVGKVPAYADLHLKVKSWSLGIAVAAVWSMASFYFLGPINSDMPWKPFSPERLAALRDSGKTVMIDFTANWCPNCHLNTKWAIEVPPVVQLVKANGVEPLLADWTDPSDDIYRQVRLLGSDAIPLLAVYPADPQAEPIILKGTINQQQLLDALKQAGPSRTPGRMTTTTQDVSNLAR